MKRLSKKAIIIISVVSLVVVAIGVTSGIILYSLFGQSNDKHEEIDIPISEIELDYSETFLKYKNTSGGSYFETFKDDEIANIAFWRLNEQDFYSHTTGTIKAHVLVDVDQSVNGFYIKNGNNYFEEDLSKTENSIISVNAANRMYQFDNKIELYKGKLVSISEGEYDESKKKEYTLDEFETLWGRTILRNCPIIISSKTIINSSRTKNGDGYTISYELDPNYSTIRYRKQMVQTGGLDEEPFFHTMKIVMTIDSSLRLVSYETLEIYDTKKVALAKDTEARIKQKYYYEHMDIPTLNERIEYENIEG